MSALVILLWCAMSMVLQSLPAGLMILGCLISASAACLLAPRARRVENLAQPQQQEEGDSISASSSLNYMLLLMWLTAAGACYGIAFSASLGVGALIVILPDRLHMQLMAICADYERPAMARDSLVVGAFLMVAAMACTVGPTLVV